MLPITPFDKALIGGLTAAVLALCARYGFSPTSQQITFLGVVLTAVVPYVITHAAIYFTRNRSQ